MRAVFPSHQCVKTSKQTHSILTCEEDAPYTFVLLLFRSASLAKNQSVLENGNSVCNIIIVHHGKQDITRHNNISPWNQWDMGEQMQHLESVGSSSDVSRVLSLPLPPDFLPYKYWVQLIEYLLLSRHYWGKDGWDRVSLRGFADTLGGGIRDLLACSQVLRAIILHWRNQMPPPPLLPPTRSHNVELPKWEATELIASGCLKF